MAFDGFITKSIINELQNTIIGAKINKVLQPNKQEIVLQLYNNAQNLNLLISTNPEFCRIHLTKVLKSNPQNAYNFCMLLRKHLTGGKIKNISNYDLERTIKIEIETYNELNDLVTKNLYVEIMSRQSNIILTNENNIILDTLKHFDNNTRELLPAHEYTEVPITKNSFIEINNLNDFIHIINNNHEEKIPLSSCIINNFIGFSKSLLKYNMNKLNIDEYTYQDQDLKRIYDYFKELLFAINKNTTIGKKISEKDYILSITDNLNNEPIDTNQFLDNFYNHKETETAFTTARNSLLKIVSASLKKIYKKLENINAKIKECEKMDTYRLYGELLTANLYKINPNDIKDNITLENYYENNNPITIKLDKKYNIKSNIDRFFKKYNKLKNTLTICSEQKKETEKELDYIESIVFNLTNATSLKDINEIYEEISENITTKKEIQKKNQSKKKTKKKDTDSIELFKEELEGYTIYIGKNNIQNDYLSLKFASPNDIWFHAQKIHGSHVLLKNSNNQELDEIPENVLFNCAKFAKENSKAKESLNVPIDYCYAKFVKKAPNSKPGMVIYTNYKTIIVK